METILQILQWLIPAECIGITIGWFVHRKVNKARDKKEIHDIFKQMYEDVSNQLSIVQKKNDELTRKVDELQENDVRHIRAINRLSRAIEAIPLCEYHSQCPVLAELRIGQDGGAVGGEAAAIHGRSDRRDSGTHQPGAIPGDGKPGTDASGKRSQQSSRRRRVQPSGRKHPRVGPPDEG